MRKVEKLSEQQFIAKFKKEGLELYKTKDLKPKLDAYEVLKDEYADLENSFSLIRANYDNEKVRLNQALQTLANITKE